MGTASATSRRRPAVGARRAKVRRRRRTLVFGFLALLGALLIIGLHPLKHAVEEITLPLKHEDIIRQQARDKHLDPALVAADIYPDSKFRDRTSSAGARGLMEITPATTRFIAKASASIRFTLPDL